MLYVYIGIPALCLLAALIFHGYKKEYFNNLASKEHPLKFLYPAVARVYDLFKRISPKTPHSKVTSLLKQLCVRENVDSEIYIYTIKKIASLIGILMAASIVGMLLCITSTAGLEVHSLSRAEYGSGSRSYQLDVEYDNTAETIDITLDAAQLTDEEIRQTFEDSFDDIINEVLQENESLEDISRPLNLITSYGSIKIQWEIEDTTLLDYNGNISEDIEENEFIPLNLYATLTLGDISEVYCVPLILTGEDVTSKELLIQNIYDSINENNSAYDTDVTLPDSINGKSLTFKEVDDNTDVTFFILIVIAVIAMAVLYDRTLDQQIKKRQDEMTLDFTEIVFKLSLLYEAGLSIFRAWERIVTEYEAAHPDGSSFAYREMRLTLEQIKNGASEAAAYGQFGKRCGLQQYVKLGNLLEQNLAKGTKGLKLLLRQEAQDSFEVRKRLARKKGEEASTKMMIPMIMMLVVVLVIIAVPAVMSINF